MLFVEKIKNFNEFIKIKDLWNQLLAESEIDNPYLTHDWFRIAYQSFENKNELFVLLVYEKNKVVAIAPFLLSKERKYGLWLKTLRFLENVHTPFQDFIIIKNNRETLISIVDFLIKNFKLWDILELKEIRKDSVNIKILENLCKVKSNFHYQFLMSRNWTVFTNMPWEERLSKMKSKFKRNLRRRVRKLEKRGKLSFHTVSDVKSIEKHLDQFFSIHSSTWKGNEKNSEFYYEIAREFGKSNNFKIYYLCLNERPIAYMFGLKYKSALFGIKTTYDPSYSQFSPGTFMFYKIVEKCSKDKNIKKFDIGRGDERYKCDLTCRPVDQLIFIAGHKKTLVSYIYHIRFKIVLFFKHNNLMVDELAILRNAYSYIKKVKNSLKQNLISQSQR